MKGEPECLERPSRRGYPGQALATVPMGEKEGREAVGTPTPPAAKQDSSSPYVEDNEAKAQMLAERFFPMPVDADLTNITNEGDQGRQAEHIYIEKEVTVATIQAIIQQLLRKKAPGPDGITNEVIKICSNEISTHLADIAKACFTIGYHPTEFRRTTTVVLQKEGKPDYSLPGSYCPIMLESTLGKIIEKIATDRLSAAAESHGILPHTQMGARSRQSTLSALSLLVDVVHIAWV